MAALYSGDGQGTHNGAVFVRAQAYSFDSIASNSMKSSNPHSGCRKVEIAKTLDTSTPDPSKNQGDIAILTEVAGFVGKAAPSAGNIGYAKELAPTLLAGKEMHVAIYDIQHRDDVIRPIKDGIIPTLSYSIVRRFTPTECERLQGLDDGYTDGGSDTARYKALGNGMAQPCADYVMRRIVECAEEMQ